MQRVSTHTPPPQKNREGERSETVEEEDEYDEVGGVRDKWMQGLKTPNMRTIKILKSPSEKEYLYFLYIFYCFIFDDEYIISHISKPTVYQCY